MFTNSNTKLLLVVLLAMVLICMLNTGESYDNNKENVEIEALTDEPDNMVENTETVDTNTEQLVKPNDVSNETKELISNEDMINSVLEPMTDVQPSDNSNVGGADVNQVGTSITAQNMQKLQEENEKNKLKFDAGSLLPKEVNDQWFESDFGQNQVNVEDSNLIVTDRYITGVNTVGQSLKNPSYDLRAAPACPKFSVSPWGQSSIEPDFNIKPLL